MPKLNEVLFGKKDKAKQLKTTTPDQDMIMKLIRQGLAKGEGPFADLFGGFDKEAFEQGVNQPALKNFQDNILPQLQEKFIAGNQVLGSGMRNAQTKAATDLQSQLAALMYQAQQGQQANRLSGINSLLGKQGVENIYKKGNEGLIPGVAKGFAEGAGNAAGTAVVG
jgi:hypothetical protein